MGYKHSNFIQILIKTKIDPSNAIDCIRLPCMASYSINENCDLPLKPDMNEYARVKVKPYIHEKEKK